MFRKIFHSDAVLQRKRLSKRKDYLSAAEGAKLRASLRQLDLEVRDAAQVVREAQEDLENAQVALEELEVRHWALLSQYEAEKEFQRMKQTKDDGLESGQEGTGVSDTGADVRGDEESS